jgi:hypothetical protein
VQRRGRDGGYCTAEAVSRYDDLESRIGGLSPLYGGNDVIAPPCPGRVEAAVKLAVGAKLLGVEQGKGDVGDDIVGLGNGSAN